MDATAFENLANETLERLFDAIEDALGDDGEVDFENGILTVELSDGRQYVINKHAQNQQIWLSSPISGAAHFKFDDTQNTWVSTRNEAVFLDVLSAEMSALSDSRVEFSR